MKELDAASDLLCTAIDKYLKTCSAFRDSYIQNIVLNNVPQELLDFASKELLLATSYEMKIKQAKAAISLARNSAPAVVPINSLPSEILTRIFHLVLSAGYKSGNPLYVSNKTLPQDLLSHVCSRWRQIATSTRTLWSHVDLALYRYPYQTLLNRAETYIARAGHVPLDVRAYIGDSVSRCEPSTNASLVQLFATVAPQIQSLELYTHGAVTELYCSIFQSCFARGVPGTFTKFVLWTDEDTIDGPSHDFIETINNSTNTRSLVLDLPQQLLDDFWHPITVMRLRGLYPYWTSKAYHGLVELRLTSSSRLVSIPESHLINILTASPGLRIFSFGLLVVDSCPVRAPVVPVYLSELEVLAFVTTRDHTEDEYAIATFFRLIAPGSKPLTLSIVQYDYSDIHMLDDEFKKFLSRANVVELRLAGGGTYPLVAGVLRLSPHLRVLALESFSIMQNHTPGPNSGERDAQGTRFCLDTLHLGGCEIDLDELRRIVESEIVVRSLTLWDYYDSDGEEITEEAVRTALSASCPVISFIEPKIDSSLMRDWEELP